MGPGMLAAEGGAVDEIFGAGRTVQLLLLEDGAETITIYVSAQAKRAGVVADGVHVKVDQDWRSGEFVEELLNDGFHSWGEDEFDALHLRRVLMRRTRVDVISR